MAASWDLPTEVFTQVFSLISRHQLISCALVSKLWHARAVAILYQKIDLTWSRPFKKCLCFTTAMNSHPCLCEQIGTCRPEQHEVFEGRRHVPHTRRCLKLIPCSSEKWPSLFALTKTLIHSPLLARLVRHLRLAGPVPRSVWMDPQHTGLSNEEHRYIRSILPCESGMSKAGWLRRLDNGCPHAFAALLLTCIPNLRSIDLGPRFQDSLQIIGPRLLGRTLQHLDVAAVGVVQETVWTNRGELSFRQDDGYPQLLLLRLGIRSLSLNLPRSDTLYHWLDITCGALTTWLETLELAFTFLDEHDLAHLLQVCPHLRNFKYDYWTSVPSLSPAELHQAPYTPDRQSERLVETQVLQNSLNTIQRSLVTLHIHIVPPTDRFNQNLRSIDFSRYESLTELHAPLQLLVSKDAPRSLADSLPPSLRRLWLNDDATWLWLNHDYLLDRWNYDIEIENIDVTDRSWHPTYTDREVVDLISHFLSDWRSHVPDLQVLRLLMGHVHADCRLPRNIHYLRRTLEPAGKMVGIDTTVTQVQINTRYNLVTLGQDPPWFSEERIEERLCHNCDRLLGIVKIYDSDTDE